MKMTLANITSGCIIITFSILYSCNQKDQVKFDVKNTFPWCIVAYDSMNRTPAQRIQMLHDFGFTKYAYDWRDHHLDDMQEEILLANESGIEVISVWLWLNAKRDSLGKLGPANQKIFEIIENSQLKTNLWLSFSNNFFEGLSQEQCLEKAIALVEYISIKASKIDCKVLLYNHTGWFGDPCNQVEIIKNLPQNDLKIVYNFHHGHDHIDDFEKVVKVMLPYLAAVNLNGMKKGGPKILPVGQGDNEEAMIQVLLDNGYNGPWGLLGHVENVDVKNTLNQNINGLKKLFY